MILNNGVGLRLGVMVSASKRITSGSDMEYYDAKAAISSLVWNYGKGDPVQIHVTSFEFAEVKGFVTTQKQYGKGKYHFTINPLTKSVKMLRHTARYSYTSGIETEGIKVYHA